MTSELKTRRVFHLDYLEKACQDHATSVIFNNSLKAGSHDPFFFQFQEDTKASLYGDFQTKDNHLCGVCSLYHALCSSFRMKRLS